MSEGIIIAIDSGQIDLADRLVLRLQRDRKLQLGRIEIVAHILCNDLLIRSVLIHGEKLRYLRQNLPLRKVGAVIGIPFPE